jgi:purine-binding chemotaxis protein CheW
MTTQPLARQYVTFHVADLLLGIEVNKVQEVLRPQTLTQVPLAPGVVEGLMNLRGQIVVAIDTRRSLGLPAAPTGFHPMNVVLQALDGGVSLLVDNINDVIDLSLDAWTAVPENLPAAQRSLLNGVFHVQDGANHDGLMFVLDTDRLLEQASTGEPSLLPASPANLHRSTETTARGSACQ